MVNATPRPLFLEGKDPVPIVQEAGLDSGTFCKGAGSLAVTGIRSRDCPTHSESGRVGVIAIVFSSLFRIQIKFLVLRS